MQTRAYTWHPTERELGTPFGCSKYPISPIWFSVNFAWSMVTDFCLASWALRGVKTYLSDTLQTLMGVTMRKWAIPISYWEEPVVGFTVDQRHLEGYSLEGQWNKGGQIVHIWVKLEEQDLVGHLRLAIHPQIHFEELRNGLRSYENGKLLTIFANRALSDANRDELYRKLRGWSPASDLDEVWEVLMENVYA